MTLLELLPLGNHGNSKGACKIISGFRVSFSTSETFFSDAAVDSLPPSPLSLCYTVVIQPTLFMSQAIL